MNNQVSQKAKAIYTLYKSHNPPNLTTCPDPTMRGAIVPVDKAASKRRYKISKEGPEDFG